MLLRLAILALLPVFAAAVFGGMFFYFYPGRYAPPPSVEIPFQQITSPAAPEGAFTDSSATQVQNGLLVVDALHRNAFREDEITAFSSRVASRGYDVEFVGSFHVVEEEVRLYQLVETLRRANSFVVILPQEDYSEAEAALVEGFVRKGGEITAGFRPLPSAADKYSGRKVRAGFPAGLPLQHSGIRSEFPAHFCHRLPA